MFRITITAIIVVFVALFFISVLIAGVRKRSTNRMIAQNRQTVARQFSSNRMTGPSPAYPQRPSMISPRNTSFSSPAPPTNGFYSPPLNTYQPNPYYPSPNGHAQPSQPGIYTPPRQPYSPSHPQGPSSPIGMSIPSIPSPRSGPTMPIPNITPLGEAPSALNRNATYRSPPQDLSPHNTGDASRNSAIALQSSSTDNSYHRMQEIQRLMTELNVLNSGAGGRPDREARGEEIRRRIAELKEMDSGRHGAAVTHEDAPGGDVVEGMPDVVEGPGMPLRRGTDPTAPPPAYTEISPELN